MAILKNAKVQWASVHDVNPMSNKYQIDIVNMTDAQIKQLTDAGVRVNECDDPQKKRGFFVTMKSVIKPDVVDKGKRDFTKLIGNGSVCNIIWHPFEWTFKKKTGTSAGLDKIQVLKHVPFGDDFDNLEEAGEGGNCESPNDDDESPY